MVDHLQLHGRKDNERMALFNLVSQFDAEVDHTDGHGRSDGTLDLQYA